MNRCVDCGELLDGQLAIHPMCRPCCTIAVYLLGSVETRIHQLEGASS